MMILPVLGARLEVVRLASTSPRADASPMVFVHDEALVWLPALIDALAVNVSLRPLRRRLHRAHCGGGRPARVCRSRGAGAARHGGGGGAPEAVITATAQLVERAL